MKKQLLILFFTILATGAIFGQEPVDKQIIFNSALIEKIIIALISAVLGFTFNYLLALRKEKKERKQLSYELTVKEAITREDSPIKDKVRLKYNGNEVENLVFVSCSVQNTGKIVVKDESLRFTFPDDCIILENYIDPKPEPELGIADETVDINRHMFEKKTKISHLTKNKTVNFHFIISGKNARPNIHDFNPVGDVEFNEKSVNISKNDKQILREFILTNLTLLLLYVLISVFANISNIYDLILILNFSWVAGFIVANLFFIKDIARIFSDLIFGKREGNKSSFVQIEGSDNIVINRVDDSSVRIDSGKPGVI